MPKKEDKIEESQEVTEAVDATVEAAEVPEAAPAVEDVAIEETTEAVTEDTKEVVDEEVEIDTAEETKNIEEPVFESANIETDKTVTVQPVKFASFEDVNQTQGEANKNLEILMDIKLQLTVELGRTELPIKKVLELTRGSIIELEKIAGEPVELYANGKLVAHGEVVVIEDNFGLRITSITEPEDRLKGL